MEKVIGIGGVFIRARDPVVLASWYKKHLGLAIEAEWNGATLPGLERVEKGTGGIWSAFPQDTEYFGSDQNQFMINFRVPDRDAMLAQLRAADCNVDERTEDSEYGRFGWVTDPEGNRVELWQAPTDPQA
ncbi:MAG: glyoxalase [Planctomycetes bacterium]|nr:glyoxalase [Planctomycetota bacterium]